MFDLHILCDYDIRTYISS